MNPIFRERETEARLTLATFEFRMCSLYFNILLDCFLVLNLWLNISMTYLIVFLESFSEFSESFL